MVDDIVNRLRQLREVLMGNPIMAREVQEAMDEIERLRRWASYEHAGYCACCGGDKECLEKAYATWKKMFDE